MVKMNEKYNICSYPVSRIKYIRISMYTKKEKSHKLIIQRKR